MQTAISRTCCRYFSSHYRISKNDPPPNQINKNRIVAKHQRKTSPTKTAEKLFSVPAYFTQFQFPKKKHKSKQTNQRKASKMADSSSPTALTSPTPSTLKSPVIDPAVFRGNRTNAVVSLEDPTQPDTQWSAFYKESEDVFGEFYTFELQQRQAAAAIASASAGSGASFSGAAAVDTNISLRGAQLAAAMNTAITVPKGVNVPPPPATIGGARAASARQLSGQLDDEVARSWDEDWEDEDTEDAFDVVMGKIAAGATAAAAQ